MKDPMPARLARWAAIALLAAAGCGYGQLPAPADRCKGPAGTLAPGCQAAGGANGAATALSATPPIPAITHSDPLGPDTPPAPVRIAPEPPGEFQRFVEAAAGRLLPLFGASLFDKAPSTFAPVERVPVTADYVIGPGDQILLRVWGQVNLNLELTVDRGGAIHIPQAGSAVVAGLPYQQLPGFLRGHLEQVFRNFELQVNLGQLRSIQLFVVGHARRPGAYTVSALSTLVSALFASGGPAGEGSLRRIQLKRQGRMITEFDVYDLLLLGDPSKDVRLLPGDVLYIPPAGPQVAVAGSVKVPGIYELKGETTTGGLIQMAGGLTQVADGRRATLERIGGTRWRQTTELALDAAGLAAPLENGDILQILSITPRFLNAVTLRGNVAEPGRFAWHPGMRLLDLIPNKESLVTRAYWRRHNQAAAPPVRPESGPPASGKPEKELAPINWAYAVVERRDQRDLSTQLLPFHPGKLLLDGDEKENLELAPGDIVTVFSQADIRVPRAQQARVVRLEGEIRSAGSYTVRDGETLRQVIGRAGGLTEQAYIYGAEFLRESTRREQQARLDRSVQEWERELEQQALQRSERSVLPEDAARVKAEQEQARRLVERIRAIRATGRIVLGWHGEQQHWEARMDLPLEDGDVFLVPARPATVHVLGAVYNQNAFLHQEQLRVADYLHAAGGPTRSADRDRTYIVRADGSVVPRQSSLLFRQKFEETRLYPGDSVVVPEALPKASLLRGLRDWTQVFSQLALGAAAVNVLK